MTSVETFAGGDSYDLSRSHPERMYGLIHPSALESYELGFEYSQIFDDLQEYPPSEVTFGGRLYAVLNHEEDNVVSILSRSKGPSHVTEGSVRIFRIRAVSLIRGEDGTVWGEGHNAREIVRSGTRSIQIAEDETSVSPLNEEEKQLFVHVSSILESRRPR